MIIVLLLSSIFGFVLSSTLLLKGTTNTIATRILGCFYLLLSLYALHTYIYDGGYLEHFQWFFLWPLLLYNFIFIPIYYYFKVVLTDRLNWHKAELILFIPLLLGLVDVVYIYLQPASVYNSILSETISSPETRLSAQYLLLRLDQHLLIRHCWQLGVLLLLLPKIKFFITHGEADAMKSILNKWLLVFWGILMLMAILAIFYALEKMALVKVFDSLIIVGEKGGIITFFLYIALFIIGVIPIYFPSILYGYPQRARTTSNGNKDVKINGLKFGLDEEGMNLKLEKIKQNKLYLKKNFNLTECARVLQMPSHHISYFLKQQYEVSFAEYKNGLRMEYAEKLIRDGYLENNTIEALAQECGFVSRTSFSKTFKSHVEISPSEYALAVK
ncbi:helix-turn-helix domain-containing protein [Salegentibacter sp. BLCTC]|uniref:helix-turn-helix transcriptional regulator n=1 Tax=Salegentibacter sp. BLCTC TaxID=2697368 RepID=UPI00187B88C3|nr:AraC family transcriptional regulator [Salegentibacter sp. BLCTC]MBE7640865.1 helix-turn-helix domain-containing protein [Salegentibacter sp. BLCTC]